MADNLTTGTTLSSPPSGSVIAARQVTYSGDSAYIAPVGLATFSGADDSKTATDVPAGGGVEAAALRVTIATDSTGVLSVDDNGGSLTVDGTVAVSGTVAVTDNGGNLSIDDGGNSITVDGTVTAAQATAANLNATVVGTGTFAVQNTQAGTASQNVAQLAGTTTDTNSGNKSAGTLRVVLATDQPALTNKLLVTPDSVALPANQSVNVAQINGVATTMGNGASGTGVQRVTLANDSTGVLATVSTVTTVSTITGGGVAHDGADSGNPIKVGFKAETSPKGITLVADGDRADAYCDADGLLMVKLNTSGADIISERVSNTDGSSTAFSNFTAVASTKNYITGITCYRTDAGTSVAYIDFRDGTAGSILWSMPLPPNGGSTESWATPAFHTSANTALAFDVSAALTTVYINVTGFQSKV